MKPSTLSKMEVNKKNRSEEEFNKLFFKKPNTMTENFNKSASKFEII